MKILHLALEDHARPGAGGGSLRNLEVNRRLSQRGHEIVVVAADFPGARTRTEDGVFYRHTGLPIGYLPSLISYQASLPFVVGRASRSSNAPDLIVEEFAPPISSLAVGRWTQVPVVGNVQGYFAEQKAREYHLPKQLLLAAERKTTSTHSHLIAASDGLARRLRVNAPSADIRVIPLGVSQAEITDALATPQAKVPGRLLFLGRLELQQKGLDLLLEACDGLLSAADATLVIAGDGKDADRVRAHAAASADADRVTFLGRVTGAEKWRLLASAQALVMPSRYETFGLAALEALACGTAVIHYEIESLRETVPPDAGVAVPPFEVPALREAIRAVLFDAAGAARMGQRGRTHALAFTWDRVTDAQEKMYEAAVADR